MGKSTINPAVVGKHSTDIAALKNDLGIVEDGDTATHTIAQGQYVIWQGALYTADAAIASGTTLAASGGNKNLTVVENGGLNALNASINNWETLTLSPPKGIANGIVNRYLKLCIVSFSIENNASGYTLSLPNDIVAAVTVSAGTRYSGFMRIGASSSDIGINTSTAWDVGQIVIQIL